MSIKHWREASTVIVAALKPQPTTGCNYKVITLKRSAGNEFMPGGYVFPGGTTHPSDSDSKWFTLFNKFNVSEEYLKNACHPNLPPIFHIKGEGLPKHVSMKITAIRETFEETGILLCRNSEDVFKLNNLWTSFQSYRQLGRWRAFVQKQPEEFLNMCQHFGCCPDIWGLKLWSNWLTPRIGNPKRFDTIFYISTLKNSPASNADEAEVEKLAWFPPQDIISMCKNKEIWLPPPQLYETSRLLRFSHVEQLSDFAAAREEQGCERWMPERVSTSDGLVSLLPGDQQYKDIDLTTGGYTPTVNMSTEQYRSRSKTLHRIEQVSERDGTIVISNYNPTHGHILPLIETSKPIK